MAAFRGVLSHCTKRFTRQTRCIIFQTITLNKVENSSKVQLCKRPQSTIAQKRKLFTPGPLSISERVKNSMLGVDPSSRHADFTYVVRFVQHALLQLANVSEEMYTVIPLNGSGTIATESILRTILGSSNKKLLILDNGLYAKKIVHICRAASINYKVIPVNIKKLQETLLSHNDIDGVIAVHCETSTGKVNDVEEMGRIIKKCAPDCVFFVDAITSFGAIPFNMMNIDFLISTCCKCLQGVPGISFIIAGREMLAKHRCNDTGMVLDVAAQSDELDRTGEFRFTPPTHVMLAFKESLLELSDEGGLEGRAARYKENAVALKSGMAEIGFRQLFNDCENENGYIVTAFYCPKNPLFILEEFSSRLSDAGYVIAPERTTDEKCFRIANIGHVFPEDVRQLIINIRQVCTDMNMKLPLSEFPFKQNCTPIET